MREVNQDYYDTHRQNDQSARNYLKKANNGKTVRVGEKGVLFFSPGSGAIKRDNTIFAKTLSQSPSAYSPSENTPVYTVGEKFETQNQITEAIRTGVSLVPIVGGSVEFFSRYEEAIRNGDTEKVTELERTFAQEMMLSAIPGGKALKEVGSGIIAGGKKLFKKGEDVAGAGRELSGKVGDAENKVPYDSAKWREHLENTYGADNVTSTTAPKNPRQRVNSDTTNEIFVVTDANGGKAVQMKFNDPVTGELKSANIPYNKRGLPVFDDHAKFTTTIDHSKSTTGQMRQATRDLRDAIDAGNIDTSQFTDKQLKNIRSGDDKIKGFTWHHNADTGNMQLVPHDLHDTVKHIGQSALKEGR